MSKRRKSIRKEAVKLIAEGKESRINFTLTQENNLCAKLQNFKENPELIKFGELVVGQKTLKLYAFKNQPKLAFIRINDEFIPLNNNLWREVFRFWIKGAWFLGTFGKRAKKYYRSVPSLKLITDTQRQIWKEEKRQQRAKKLLGEKHND
jgi:hypothetical protein